MDKKESMINKKRMVESPLWRKFVIFETLMQVTRVRNPGSLVIVNNKQNMRLAYSSRQEMLLSA